MRVITVGMGVQGAKRARIAGAECVATVDPVAADVDYKNVRDVPLDTFDAALLCIPDGPKIDLLTYLAEHGKHALVEKPLFAANNAALSKLEAIAQKTGAYIYTAYNHRFEPHYAEMAKIVASGRLGRIYRCRMFYGNGTARLVRNSDWRDQGAGVLPDLGSHLLDTARFWFGDIGDGFELVSCNAFENRAPDHVVLRATDSPVDLELEMTLLSWRNHFTCDIFAEKGSAHISSLCKWGPTELTVRTRILPSGRPPEESQTLVQDDPTWALEYDHFKQAIAAKTPTDLSNDLWLNTVLGALGADAEARVKG